MQSLISYTFGTLAALFSIALIEKLGETGLGALNRILGFSIFAIAVQFIANRTFDAVKRRFLIFLSKSIASRSKSLC